MNNTILTLFILIISMKTFSQTGPGGVGTVDGTSDVVLWLDANTISQSDNTEVTSWTDQSGYGNNASAPAGTGPQFRTLQLNNYPHVEFDITNTEYMEIVDNVDGSLDPTEITIFVVGNVTASSHNYGPFVFKSSTGGWTDSYSLMRDVGNQAVRGYVNHFDNNRETESVTYGVHSIMTMIYDKTGPEVYVNESSTGTDNYTADITATSTSVWLGYAWGGYYLDGDIAEIIIIKTSVNDAERIIIHNYLAAKYGLSLGINDVYNEDDAGDYDHEVAGIGRVDASNILNDAKGSGMVRIENPSNLGDGEYLIWGHDNQSTFFSTCECSGNDLSAAIHQVIPRTWRMSETGSVGDVDIHFDLTGYSGITTADLRLVIDLDNDGSFADETVAGGGVISGATVSGSIYEFAAVDGGDFDDNSRFTIGTVNGGTTHLTSDGNVTGGCSTGPGGVGATDGTSDVVLWLDANTVSQSDNTEVTSWTDQSGYGNNASAPAGTGPQFRTLQLNNYPHVEFDVANTEYMEIVDNVDGSLDPTEITIFVVGNVTASSHNYGSFVFKSSTSGWADSYSLMRDVGNQAVRGYVNHWDNNRETESVTYGVHSIMTMIYDKTGPEVYINESNTGTDNYTADITATSTSVWLGYAWGGYYLDGDIAEIIIIKTSVNDAERIIIHNYLAAKYGLSLGSDDVYNEDDAGDYDHEVAGIGRVDASNIHNDAQGKGIVRILNPTGLGDDEFLLWGHDNGNLQATETTDVPVGVQARFSRTWRVSEANSSGAAVDVGNIDMRWELTGLGTITTSDLRLLVDTDDDGIFSDETPISGATSLGNNIYQFAAVSAIANNLRFTLATINSSQTPLPIKIIGFNAKVIDDKMVGLDWQTALEINNDYFTIERSKDGHTWKELINIDGAGNSFIILNYNFIDKNPYLGILYYRLKQTDFDGQYEYSQIKSVNIERLENSRVSIYPSPTTNYITIVADQSELEQIKIYNVLGQDVTKLTKTIYADEIIIKIDLTGLNSGMYYIKTKTTANKVNKQ